MFLYFIRHSTITLCKSKVVTLITYGGYLKMIHFTTDTIDFVHSFGRSNVVHVGLFISIQPSNVEVP